jgi:hypothetical protein
MAQLAVVSSQHIKDRDVDMSKVSIRDQHLGQGVAAAVLHVAAASARGSRELAMELNAARDAVDSATDRRRYAAPFDASFSRHLSLRAFADLLQRQHSIILALEPLRASVALLRTSEPKLLKIYGRLVMVAANAAARVRTEEGLFGWSRIEHSERRALDRIRSIVAASQGARPHLA